MEKQKPIYINPHNRIITYAKIVNTKKQKETNFLSSEYMIYTLLASSKPITTTNTNIKESGDFINDLLGSNSYSSFNTKSTGNNTNSMNTNNNNSSNTNSSGFDFNFGNSSSNNKKINENKI